MPEKTSFRQVDEKHVAVEVELMVWSPKFDLLALSNVQGEVVLHRLSWQKVWSLPTKGDDCKVKAMSWRPDGKVLAVGYSTGQINLCFIENAEILHTIEVKSEVTFLSWACQAIPVGTWSCEPYLNDNTETYLPKLQPLTKSYGSLSKGNVEENVEDKKKLKDQKELNLLIIGNKTNELQLYIYGIFPVAKINVGEQNNSQPCWICSASLSDDLNSLVVILQHGHDDEEQKYTLYTFDTSLLASHDKELHLLALKYGQISTLIQYLQTTIQQMQEAWEDILLEMDSKLYTFAEQKQASGASTVSNDFLELLLFGTPSTELETFLLHELTDKGLKKLGHSIETSYSNIQKLVVKHLQTVIQAILYHISELEGMSRCLEKFSLLGLDEKSIHKTLMIAGSFVLKTSELQQVIDGSIKNFKAFFRWLYVVILRLSDEKPPQELSKMTQHDVNFVAEFLRDNFEQFSPKEEEESIDDLRAVSPTDKKPGFKLEKVGQYLKKENLSYPPDISGNPWIQFCRASGSLKDSKLLYPVEINKSLIQLQEALETSMYSALHKPAVVIGQALKCTCSLFMYSPPVRDDCSRIFNPRVSQFTAGSPPELLTVFTADPVPCHKLYILRQPTDSYRADSATKILSVTFSSLPKLEASTNSDLGERSGSLLVMDLACYDNQLLSVLLAEDTEDLTPVLLQLPLSLVTVSPSLNVQCTIGVHTRDDIPEIEVNSFTEGLQYRWLDNIKARSFAVSGTRHTATVLFSSRRRVRIFLMDAEEDDEDDDDDCDGADISNQSGKGNIDIIQSGLSLYDTCHAGVDTQMESMVNEGQENKENSSSRIIVDGGDQEGP